MNTDAYPGELSETTHVVDLGSVRVESYKEKISSNTGSIMDAYGDAWYERHTGPFINGEHTNLGD